MIRDDRLQLNDRFIKVFKMLEDRGVIVKNDRSGKGMGDFAERILGNRSYGHIVRAFLNPEDKRCIDYRHAKILCKEFGINEAFLLEGEGEPFGLEIENFVPKDVYDAKSFKGNILFTTTEAFAGATIDAAGFSTEDLEYFNLPGLNGGGLVAFPIKGNSMEPIINDGDMVICKEVSGIHELRDNKMYAVKNNGRVWIKFLQRITDARGRTTHLKLISANHLEHDPFIEEVNEYTRLFQVIRRISSL